MPELRASDADRERAVAALRDHAAAGRLEAAELENRVGAALRARTLSELEPLLADLPSDPPASSRPRPRRERRPGAWAAFVRIGALLVAIWALTGAGYFWPLWPLIFLGIFALNGGCGRAGHTRRACWESQRADAVWL